MKHHEAKQIQTFMRVPNGFIVDPRGTGEQPINNFQSH